jgi:hypothetical protein
MRPNLTEWLQIVWAALHEHEGAKRDRMLYEANTLIEKSRQRSVFLGWIYSTPGTNSSSREMHDRRECQEDDDPRAEHPARHVGARGLWGETWT